MSLGTGESIQPMTDVNEASHSGRTRWFAAFWIAWLVATGLTLANELFRWIGPEEDATAGAIRWWSDPTTDWTPFLPVLLLAVPLWFVRRPLVAPAPRIWTVFCRWMSETCPASDRPVPKAQHVRALLFSGIVAAAGLAMSVSVAHRFGDLPPAYHDEYSYLFQTKTFLAGRLSFPSHPAMPELFDQMHVLNEGRFASRYFPGAGLWMAPFLAMGNAWWGHWTAHALASFLVFWIGRHLANNGVGLLAGLLVALSPGVGLFSNLLLAHHPTLVGLLVFVVTFLKFRLSVRHGEPSWGWAFVAGTGLSFAMLCRPMTAAGVGLPFGVWFGWWLLTGRGGSSRGTQPVGLEAQHGRWGPQPVGLRVRTAVALCAPLVAGFAGLLCLDQAVTGDPLLTPYQQYTDIYTPRHVYGFNNRARGETRLGPKVLENYDVWAENLTPGLAARNIWRRFVSSFRWTLGIVPLIMTTMVFLVTADRWSRDWWLIAAAILSLHAVHVPYWFEGIMGWHYVFESAPFWLLLFAGAANGLLRAWKEGDRPGMPLWGGTLLTVVLLANLVTILPLWPARIDVGVEEVAFPRLRYDSFQKTVARIVGERPALVLVEADPADRHIDYVVNSPGLDDRVLFGRYRPGETDTEAVVEAFPDRDVWLAQIATGEITLLSRSRHRPGDSP